MVGMGANGPKMLMFGQKCQFFAKFGRFWAQNPIFWGQGVKILVPSYRDSNETPFSCWKHWSVGLKLAARGENVLFWPQNLDIWGQKSIFCIVIAIYVNGSIMATSAGKTFILSFLALSYCNALLGPSCKKTRRLWRKSFLPQLSNSGKESTFLKCVDSIRAI